LRLEVINVPRRETIVVGFAIDAVTDAGIFESQPLTTNTQGRHTDE